MRIDDWLDEARRLGVARLDAQLLLAHHLGRTRSWLIAHARDDGSAHADAAVAADLQRRAEGVPLAYLLGEREFYGLSLRVTPAVLVPRPETETLVDWALEVMAAAPSATLVDLGTGSGAVALALAWALAQRQRPPRWRICATDASAAALDVARHNALLQGPRPGLEIEFVVGDWWTPLAGRRFGLAVSNPPYIAEGDDHLKALRHEPHAALTAGSDGLSALRCIVAGAPAHLEPGAWLLLEHGFDQAQAVLHLLEQAGFEDAQTRADLAGLPRCSGARWPGDR